MENKKEAAILIPYKIRNHLTFVFLQKRGKDAKVLPNYFGFFGGKVEEGESSTQALEREIKEELNFILKEYHFLNKYPSFKGKEVMLNVYFTNVDNDFEEEIKVAEGECGRFFSEKELANEKMIIDHDKEILKDLYQHLKTNFNGKF